MEMGAGASECDITIQYCMALPRHMLQSVEIQSVTQVRRFSFEVHGCSSFVLHLKAPFFSS